MLVVQGYSRQGGGFSGQVDHSSGPLALLRTNVPHAPQTHARRDVASAIPDQIVDGTEHVGWAQGDDLGLTVGVGGGAAVE